MTTAVATSVPSDVPTGTVLRRAAAAEWTRLRTLRSTWLALLAGAALMLFIGAATASGHDGESTEPIWRAAQTGLWPGQFAFLLVVLLAVTGEYSTGANRSTLQCVPRRGIVLAARVLVPVGFVTACAVVVAAVTGLVARGPTRPGRRDGRGRHRRQPREDRAGRGLRWPTDRGIGLLLRSAAGTLTAIFLLILALPVALSATDVPWLVTSSEYLPGRAVSSTLVADEANRLASSTVATVMLDWTSVAVLAGGWSLIRRDTT